MKNEHILLILAISLMVTSTIAGLSAAITNDFFPSYDGIHVFFVAKAMVGTILSVICGSMYLDKRY